MFDTKKKIVVVDDMMTMRKIVKKNLSELQFTNVVEAENGAEAWKMLQEDSDVAFIISDWNMPKMSGVDLLKAVRDFAGTKTIPFIFLTAESELAQIKQALDLGADNYVLKPFTPKDLKEKLEQTFEKVKGRLGSSAA